MLTLYTKPGCPFCARVKEEVQILGVTLEEKSTADPRVIDEIVEKGGKKQVPFLLDEEADISMYGSDEIIAYLHTRFR